MSLETSTVEEPYLTVRARPAGFLLRRRFLRAFIPVAVVAIVGSATLGVREAVTLPFKRTVPVVGKAASKSEFFLDSEVKRLLLRHHLRVEINTVGSREIAGLDFSKDDFLFPTGQQAGNLIMAKLRAQGYRPARTWPFTSPIVLATFREHAEALRAAGVATADRPSDGTDPYYYQLDMKRFLELVRDGKRWNEIGPIPSANRITASTPDICSSNSASSYMALVAFVVNNNDEPHSEQEVDALAAAIKPLLKVTGMPIADLFSLYVNAEGKGVPIVTVYEHQFLSYQATNRINTGGLDSDRVLLYPSVNVRSEPQFIAITPLGAELARLLADDRDLRRRATELGFQLVNRDGAPTGDEFESSLRRQGVPVPPVARHGGTAVWLPRQEWMEKMIVLTGNCKPL